MIIGVDIDDVLLDTTKSQIEYLNNYFKTNYKKEQVVSWFLEDLFKNLHRESVESKIKDHLREHGELIPCVKGSEEAIRKLLKGNQIIAITARDAEFAEMTRRSLQKHFVGIGQIHHGGLNGGRRAKKSEIIKNEKVEVYIDDRLDIVIDCAGTGKRILLYDQPWNRNGELPANVKRIYNWDDIVEEIELIGNHKTLFSKN